jgi:Xaa-Pro aminopeptidase
MRSDWDNHRAPACGRDDVADFTARRRALFLEQLPEALTGMLLVIPAGPPKRRSNDTDYPYRPHSAFSYLTGWGSQSVPDSLLVIDAATSPHSVTLYCLAPAGRDSDEFYANAAIGEFWTGRRPDLAQVEATLGIEVRDLGQWSGISDTDLGRAVLLEDADDALTHSTRTRRLELGADSASRLAEGDALLAQTLSEMRFVKDSYEVEELRRAIESTHRGFDDLICSLPQAIGVARGERVIEGAFAARARLEGNDVGYGTIAAAGHHACILHWVKNDGEIGPNDLLLVDAGVERDSLYTADITRTLPVSGSFSARAREVYQAVLEAADRAFEAVRPGVPFRTIHDTAMAVIANKLEGWGFLPVSAEESLSTEGGQHRRYMIHGTCHHLGLDVHDCAQARRELYLDQELRPGMVFTIEPGLYFQADDLTVPAEWRGIGVRIEDNILVTETGAENLSRDIPRDPDAVEAWVRTLLRT